MNMTKWVLLTVPTMYVYRFFIIIIDWQHF